MCACDTGGVTINTETLERLVHHPEQVLEAADDFWEHERAQYLTKLWAEQVRYDIPFDRWADQVRAWADIPLEERTSSALMRNVKILVESKEDFLAKAMPHLRAFFPEQADLDVTVHFTAFIPTNAFAKEDIVINVAADYWKNDVSHILNLLVHEIGHAGYSYCREVRTEGEVGQPTLDYILDNFQSEGLCTYIGYTAQALFPAPGEKDYILLDNSAEVRGAFRRVNEVLSKVGQLPDEEVRKLAWDACVIERGYYVAGAFMFKTIDETSGRQALIETLTTGPVSWVERYNALAEEDLKLKLGTMEEEE